MKPKPYTLALNLSLHLTRGAGLPKGVEVDDRDAEDAGKGQSRCAAAFAGFIGFRVQDFHGYLGSMGFRGSGFVVWGI